MSIQLRLMAILAHPDDETLGFGGVLARYAAEGVETHLVVATRGEHGWFGAPEANPGPAQLGRIRQHELGDAAVALGVRSIGFLDYFDGELDQADPDEVVPQIVDCIRAVRPDVVMTFGHDGIYGHPDHIAISQFTTAAVVAAADIEYTEASLYPPHRVSKLYYRAPSPEYVAAYEEAFGELVMEIDGQERRSPGWGTWTINASIDTTAYWPDVWRAVQCHRSQLPGYDGLLALPAERHAYLWGTQEYYRVFSLVNAGRTVERDLFEGLREESPGDAARTVVAA